MLVERYGSWQKTDRSRIEGTRIRRNTINKTRRRNWDIQDEKGKRIKGWTDTLKMILNVWIVVGTTRTLRVLGSQNRGPRNLRSVGPHCYQWRGWCRCDKLSVNSLSSLSATILAIASEEVAPGEGALRQCRIRPLLANTKSSIRDPSTPTAWALTPDGPLRHKTLCCSKKLIINCCNINSTHRHRVPEQR